MKQILAHPKITMNLTFAAAWAVSAVPAYLFGWLNSIVFLAVISIVAPASSHLSGWFAEMKLLGDKGAG